jgi:hypothetical protein
VKNDLLGRLGRRHGAGIDDELGVGRFLVGVGDPGELFQDARPRLRIEALSIPLLAHLLELSCFMVLGRCVLDEPSPS